jgi:hypothetical protein
VPDGLAARLADGALAAAAGSEGVDGVQGAPVSSPSAATPERSGLLDALRVPALATAAATLALAVGLTLALAASDRSSQSSHHAVASLMQAGETELQIDALSVAEQVLATEEQ